MLNLNNAVERIKDASGLKELQTDSESIAFATEPELYGAIPEPIPANKVLPDWYKNLGQYAAEDNEDGDVTTNTRPSISSSTVKRCAPFMEAMTMGWIIPLAGEVQFFAEDGVVQYNWDFDRDLVSNHNMAQVGGDEFAASDWPIMKFHNYWSISAPEGYSALITAPMNRPGQPFMPFSGVVDIDSYFNEVNAPFMWTGGEFDGILETGTPVVQVIPFKRDSLVSDATARPLTDEEALEKKRSKAEISSHTSMYRERRWQPKKGSRMVPHEEPESDDSGSSCPFHL